MPNLTITNLRDAPELTKTAASWFHSKWKIPVEAYLESITECLSNKTGVPQWYLVLDKDKIAAGLGVIENDFHKRTDLCPNICAVYVEPSHRMGGVAKMMLDYVCRDLQTMDYNDIYLVTEHTDFYEKCGFKFFCMVEDNEGGHMTRMYHKTLNAEA